MEDWKSVVVSSVSTWDW